MKKRVLQFIGSFHQGGSERQAVSLTKRLVEENFFDITVATLNNEGILKQDIDRLEVAIAEFKLDSFFRPSFLLQALRCAKWMRSNRIDLVHTHDFYTNVFGITAARLAGIEARVASKRETTGMRTPAQDRVEKFAFGFSKSIVVNSKAVQAHLIDRGIAPGKLHLIYNGLDLSCFTAEGVDRKEILARLGLEHLSSKRLVTLVANLRHDVKNVPMLLRAMQRITAETADVDLVIAGEGELEQDLRAMAKGLRIDERVHFIGRCSRVPELLSASTVCVLTSKAEGFSNSLLEYMAAVRPVVATNVGGAAEVIEDGVNGYLVESDDDTALADQLINLLTDETKARSFGLAGRRVAKERFSDEIQLEKTLGLYRSLL